MSMFLKISSVIVFFLFDVFDKFKDKKYLKLQVNQVRKRSKKKKVRAMEQLHIYLHSSQLENPLVPG